MKNEFNFRDLKPGLYKAKREKQSNFSIIIFIASGFRNRCVSLDITNNKIMTGYEIFLKIRYISSITDETDFTSNDSNKIFAKW